MRALQVNTNDHNEVGEHYALFRPVTREIHWINRRGQERCCGNAEEGHRCLHQVGMGRRGAGNPDENAGFCYVCRPETDEFILQYADTAVRQRWVSRENNHSTREQLRFLKQMSFNDPSQRRREEQYRSYLIRHEERAATREMQRLELLARDAAVTKKLNELQIRVKKREEELANAIYAKATEKGLDPIDMLISADHKKLAISFYHDEYVAWAKRQPDYENETCSICIEPCCDNEKYTTCGHLFHKGCLDKWNLKNGCPNCRAKCC